MSDSSRLEQATELARARLASGAGHDEVLGLLRQYGLHKGETIGVLSHATGLPLSAVKRVVHHSPVWADRREDDEALQEKLWRGLFIHALMGEVEITGSGAEVAECHAHQQRARTQLQQAAAALPDDVRYRESMAGNLLGRAFAALVVAGQRHGASGQFWNSLAEVADTLCLNEWLDEDEPAADAEDHIRAVCQAVRTVRRLAGPPS